VHGEIPHAHNEDGDNSGQQLPQVVQRLQSEPAFSGNELIGEIEALMEQRCSLTLCADHEPRSVANCYNAWI
jgi:hypothetical protein